MPIREGDRGVILPQIEENSGEAQLRGLVLGKPMPAYVVERPWHLRCFLAAVGVSKTEGV